jgi:signal transduction histidine kinase
MPRALRNRDRSHTYPRTGAETPHVVAPRRHAGAPFSAARELQCHPGMAEPRINLLLVDDDALERRAITRFVQSEALPYDLVSVGSLAEAGSMLARRTFDVAIVDQRLGDGVGIDLLPNLLGTPAIILARGGDEALAAQAVQAGTYGFLVRDSARRFLALLAPAVTSALARRRAEIAAAVRAQDLVRAQSEFQRLASMMWHELMGPLTTLAGTIEMLQVNAEQASSPLPPSTLAIIEQAVETTTELERLVTDVLGYYRLQSPPSLVTVDLDAVLADVIASLPVSIWQDAVVDVGSLPCVTGDPARLGLVFRQLLDAAHRVRGAEPLVVSIWAAEDEDAVRVSVGDNGVRTSHTDCDDVAGTDQPHGHDTGLGMSVCRHIVEQHGGRLWLERRANAGTTVHVTLPKSIGPSIRMPDSALRVTP